MKKLLLLITIMLLTGCGNKLDKEYPPVQGSRIEVQSYYQKTYGMDPGQWNENIMKAYNRDMDKAHVITD
jgi:predicted small lipoprotein YifL